MESFIIRVYRDKNRQGFIKAFTDDAEALANGFAKVDRLMKSLYVQKLYLYPRFHLAVLNSLGKYVADITDHPIQISKHMKDIQSAILVSINACLTELKKAVPHLETKSLTLENGLFTNFDWALRSQLDPEWYKLSMKTKQLVSDISDLRKLLEYLLRYDAYTFYSFLLSLRASNQAQPYPSLWFMSPSAELMFRRAKERVYRLVDIAPSESIVSLPKKLEAAKKCLPKWNNLIQLVGELKNDFSSSSNQNKRHQHKQQSSSSSSSSFTYISTKVNKYVPGRVLVLVKDERTAIHVRDILSFGVSFVMDQRHRWFISQQAADIAAKANASVTVNNRSKTPFHNNNAAEAHAVDESYLGMKVSKSAFLTLNEESKLIMLQELELRHTPVQLPSHIQSNTSVEMNALLQLSHQPPADLPYAAEDAAADGGNHSTKDTEYAKSKGKTGKIVANSSSSSSSSNKVTFNRPQSQNTAKAPRIETRQQQYQRNLHSSDSNNSSTLGMNVFEVMKQTEARYDLSSADSFNALLAAGSGYDMNKIRQHGSSILRNHWDHRRKFCSADNHAIYDDEDDASATNNSNNKDDGDDEDDVSEEEDAFSHAGVSEITDALASNQHDKHHHIHQHAHTHHHQPSPSKKRKVRERESLESTFHVVVMTHSDVLEPYEKLAEMAPENVIVYDNDLGLIRCLDTYQAAIGAFFTLKIHIMMYGESHPSIAALL